MFIAVGNGSFMVISGECTWTTMTDHDRSKFHALVQTLMLPVYQQVVLPVGAVSASAARPGMWGIPVAGWFLLGKIPSRNG